MDLAITDRDVVGRGPDPEESPVVVFLILNDQIGSFDSEVVLPAGPSLRAHLAIWANRTKKDRPLGRPLRHDSSPAGVDVRTSVNLDDGTGFQGP